MLKARVKDDLAGDWRSELSGVDLLYLEPTIARYNLEISLLADGTASWKFRLPGSRETERPERAPFPTTWDVSPDRVLLIWLPIPPMPEYEMPAWSREEICYDILAVSDISLALSNRRFDGEEVIVLRRVDAGAFERRRAQR